MTLKLVRTAYIPQQVKITRRQEIGPEKSCVLDGSIRRLANFSQILIYIPNIVSVAIGIVARCVGRIEVDTYTYR